MGRREVPGPRAGVQSTGDPSGSDLILGLDEAGRGSVIGPLIVGGFVARRSVLPELSRLGVRDSKLLSPARRVELYGALSALGSCYSVALSPRLIDRHVRHHGLNELEARAFADLLQETAPNEAFVDACDVDEGRFGRTVRRLSGTTVKVHSQHEADRFVPVVSAASIVAKVRRDQAVARIQRTVGMDFGSGYPSDERTVAFVERCLRGTPGSPVWLRESWATTKRIRQQAPARPLESFPL
jgi:ribonuclease HII